MRPPSPVATLFALAVLLVSLAGCGASGSDARQPTAEEIAAAASAAEAADRRGAWEFRAVSAR